MRTIALFLLALLVAGCQLNKAIEHHTAADPKDYKCHRADGSAAVDSEWCFPTDGTHTCCPGGLRCNLSGGCSPGSNASEYAPELGAAPVVSREPERP